MISERVLSKYTNPLTSTGLYDQRWMMPGNGYAICPPCRSGVSSCIGVWNGPESIEGVYVPVA